jgi:hypothetical protein
MGQTAKYSLRADVFRFGPNNGHHSIGSACPLGAKRRLMHRSKSPGSRPASANRQRDGDAGRPNSLYQSISSQHD